MEVSERNKGRMASVAGTAAFFFTGGRRGEGGRRGGRFFWKKSSAKKLLSRAFFEVCANALRGNGKSTGLHSLHGGRATKVFAELFPKSDLPRIVPLPAKS